MRGERDGGSGRERDGEEGKEEGKEALAFSKGKGITVQSFVFN